MITNLTPEEQEHDAIQELIATGQKINETVRRMEADKALVRQLRQEQDGAIQRIIAARERMKAEGIDIPLPGLVGE